MRTIEAVELYSILKDVKLSGMETADRMKVIRLLRSLRGVADKYNADMDLAKERMKPEGFDNLVMKMLESNESVAGGGNRIVTDGEIAAFNRMNEQFNRNMKAVQFGIYDRDNDMSGGGINDEPVDVKIESITEEAFDRLVVTNKDVSAGAWAVLYDKMVD